MKLEDAFKNAPCTIRRHTTVIEKVLPLPKVSSVILTKKLSYYDLWKEGKYLVLPQGILSTLYFGLLGV